MVKRIVRLGVESGILPKVRQIIPKLKTEWELEEQNKLGTGFSDPAMVPKGSHPNPPPRPWPTAAERIAHSAKQPKTAPPEPKTVQQEHRIMTANMRRKYFADSLETMEAIERKKLNWRQQRFEEEKKKRLENAQATENESTRYTLPTVESFLNDSFIVRRTPEEKAQLQLKREANRQATRIEVAEKKAEYLLEIYQKCDKYIVTEEELNNHLEKEFSQERKSDMEWENLLLNVDGMSIFENRAQKETEKIQKLQKTLAGYTSNGEPGLAEVQDALSGLSQRYVDELKQSSSDNN